MSNNSLKHTRQLHCSTGLVLRHHVVDDCLCQVSSVFLRVTCANLGGMETLSGPRLLYGYLQRSWVAWAGQLFFWGD